VIDFCNDRWFEYTGLTPGQLGDNAWEFLIHADDLPNYVTGWHRALMTGDSYETEFRLRQAINSDKESHGYRWHLCRAVALRNDRGDIIKWFATWTEIEEQKNKKRAR
jgi:PAS domain-containing protein